MSDLVVVFIAIYFLRVNLLKYHGEFCRLLYHKDESGYEVSGLTSVMLVS